VHSSPGRGKRAFAGDSTHRQRGLARRRRGSDDFATSGYELDDDDLRGTERVRVVAASVREEHGAAVITRGTTAEDSMVSYG
jgi:hypothetical protein